MAFKKILLITGFWVAATATEAQVKYPNYHTPGAETKPGNQISNEFMPVVGVWVWGKNDLLPAGYKKSIDHLAENSPFNLIVPFLRFPDKEITDDEVYRQVKEATEYAVSKNIGFLPDLDIRSARRAFHSKYPGEQQALLRLKQVDIQRGETTEASVTSIKDLNDHYSGGSIPKYNALESALLRVYAYSQDPEGIAANSLVDITSQCEVTYSGSDSMRIKIPSQVDPGLNKACVMTSFTLFYPDVFAPHLLDFQREVLEKYADLPLAGACKDEWGFPPYYPRFYTEDSRDFWYSSHRADAYKQRTGGRDLLSDCLLMAFPIKGKEEERQLAVNHFERMSYERNVEIEADFYDAVKEMYGADAAVTVHATWWPYPDFNEYKKNGLVWWAAKRDWAQTDELVPFAVRTALSKKWDSPLWYNMYYTMRLEDQVWGSALAGGRVNYLRYYSAYDKDIMRAENRIRLLNYISEAPLDCRAAVVFGHTATMNWAGPHFDDVGMEIVDSLWHAGYPADLIPTSEIENGSLTVDGEGWVIYGKQRYDAVVLYQPEYELPTTAEFFKKAAEGNSALMRVGHWTRDFEGRPFDGEAMLPGRMEVMPDNQSAFLRVKEELQARNIAAITPATALQDSSFFRLRGYAHTSYFPPREGFARLLDGTHIFISAGENVSGDPIKNELRVNGYSVQIDATGVAGIRLDEQGAPEALVASDLRYFKRGNFSIQLSQPLDIAMWQDIEGRWTGIYQAPAGTELPSALKEITPYWTHLLLPVPPEESE